MNSVQLQEQVFDDSDFSGFSYLSGIPDSLLKAFQTVDQGYSRQVDSLAFFPIPPSQALLVSVTQDNLDFPRSASFRLAGSLTGNFAIGNYVSTGIEIEGTVLKDNTLQGSVNGPISNLRLYEHPLNLNVFPIVPTKYGTLNGIAQFLGSSATFTLSHTYEAFEDFLNPVSMGCNPDGTSFSSGTYSIGKWTYIRQRSRTVSSFQDFYPSNTSQAEGRFGYELDTETSANSSSNNRFGCVLLSVFKGSSFFGTYGREGFLSLVSGGRVTFNARFKGETALDTDYFALGLRSSSSPLAAKFVSGNCLAFEVDGNLSKSSIFCVAAINGKTYRASTSFSWTSDNRLEIQVDPALSIARWYLNGTQVFEVSLDEWPNSKSSLVTKAYSYTCDPNSTAVSRSKVSIDYLRIHKIVSR